MIILSHAALEAAVCPGRLLDALKQRHTIDGPLRAGQGFHSWIALYLRHLVATKQAVDVERAQQLWMGLVPFLSPDTVKFVGDVPAAFASTQLFDWLLVAEDIRIEQARFFGMDRFEAAGPVVGDVVFRVTADLSFYGDSPLRPANDVAVPAGRLLHVVDWKTNWNIEHVDNPADHRQLLRYAATLWNGDDDAVVVWLCFPRRGVWEAAVFYRDRLQNAWSELIRAPSEVIANGALVDERVTGAHCLDCLLINGCDAALRFPFFAAGTEELDEVAEVTALGVVDHLKGHFEDRLRRRMHARGPLPIVAGERVVSITPSSSAVWQRPIVERELLALGLSKEQTDVAFSCTLAGIEQALASAQWKNPEKGGVKRKAREIAALMPQVHGQSMDFGRKKKPRLPGKVAIIPAELADVMNPPGDGEFVAFDVPGLGVEDDE